MAVRHQLSCLLAGVGLLSPLFLPPISLRSAPPAPLSCSSGLVSYLNSFNSFSPSSPGKSAGSSGFGSTCEGAGFLGLSSSSIAAWGSPSTKPKLVRALVTKQLENTAGHFHIYLTKEAIRIDGFQGQASIIAKAPSWEVVSFNKEGFRYAMPLVAWRRTGLGANATDLRPYFAGDLKVERSDLSAYGHKVVCYSRRLRFIESSKPSKPGNAGAGEVGQIRLRLVTDVDLSEGAQEVLRGFFKLPNFKGLPVSFSVESNRQKEEFQFSTESLKYEQIDPSIFLEPKGLKPAKSINRVFFGKATEDLIMEFCNERK